MMRVTFVVCRCPPPLPAIAHAKLDEAVLDAYGWPQDLADAEILERLLALNLIQPQLREALRPVGGFST